MDAESLLDFNSLKAATQRALWPAVVTFAHTGTIRYDVTFGEIDNDGSLQDSGQGVQHHRIGSLHFPVLAGFAPTLLQSFTIVSASQAALVGKKYRIARVQSAPGEPTFRCLCTRIEA